jgi:hypothetical protein
MPVQARLPSRKRARSSHRASWTSMRSARRRATASRPT